MFFKDLSKMRYRDPRSLSEAFGPYSTQKLFVPQRRSRLARFLSATFWIVFYGTSISVFWYLLLLMKAAS